MECTRQLCELKAYLGGHKQEDSALQGWSPEEVCIERSAQQQGHLIVTFGLHA